MSEEGSQPDGQPIKVDPAEFEVEEAGERRFRPAIPPDGR